MEPIYIILYAVVLTLILTLVIPRFGEPSPALRRLLWISTIFGCVVLLIVTFLVFRG
jgi:hypothetical protein